MIAVKKIVDLIAESMKAGTPPWRKPWFGVPTNAFTLKPYSGLNVLILDAMAIKRGYPSKYWATYRQWGWLGCNIRRRPDSIAEGEWAVAINRSEAEKGIKTAWVFNGVQIFGSEADKWNVTERPEPNYDVVERIIQAVNAQWIFESVEHAEYRRPPHDDIVMPFTEQFENNCQLYATKLHELVHWCEWRTGWKGSLEQGELIAEIATGLIENELLIPHCNDMSNHEKYLSHWLQEMAVDANYFVSAYEQAKKAVAFILKNVPKKEGLTCA